MSVILLEWQGERWIPAGPGNGRQCVFPNRLYAQAWVSKTYYDPGERWRFSTVETPPPLEGWDCDAASCEARRL